MTVSFTQKGCRLISKKIEIPIRKIDLTSKEIQIPQDASTIDIVKLERKFGEEKVQIFSFKDYSGKLIKRVQEAVSGTNVEKQISDYEFGINAKSSSRIMNRKIFKNGKIVSEIKENIVKSSNNVLNFFLKSKHAIAKTMFTRVHINSLGTKSQETSFFGEFKNKTNPKKLIASFERNTSDEIKLKGIKYAGISLDTAKKLAGDPYIGMRLLSMEDFVKTLKHLVYKQQGIEKTSIKTSFDDLAPNNFGHVLADESGNLDLVLNRNFLNNRQKPLWLNSFNHEARHCRQQIYTYQLDYLDYGLAPYPQKVFYQKTFGKVQKQEEIELARKIKVATDSYEIDKKDPEKYFNNFTEVDARKAGTLAQEEYEMYANHLAKEINLTTHQLGLGLD